MSVCFQIAVRSICSTLPSPMKEGHGSTINRKNRLQELKYVLYLGSPRNISSSNLIRMTRNINWKMFARLKNGGWKFFFRWKKKILVISSVLNPTSKLLCFFSFCVHEIISQLPLDPTWPHPVRTECSAFWHTYSCNLEQNLKNMSHITNFFFKITLLKSF